MIKWFPAIALLALACRTPAKIGDTSDTPSVTDADGDGWAAGDDCDDGDASVHPDADESCDGIDNDCDGQVDEGVTTTWYADADADGYGDPNDTAQTCGQPSGMVANADDCDDTDADIHPGAPERCNDLDDDCDGDIDEDVIGTWYADTDGDGYGDVASPLETCDPPDGYVTSDDDCDDTRDDVHPDAAEVCDGADNDCDGTIDDGATDASTWYADTDGDGYGDPSVTSTACDQPSGSVADDTDCDDADASVHPSATEVCNEVDDDCDGTIDLGAADASTWYADTDGDGYGDPSVTSTACDQPSGSVADDTDCDDADASINPGATEVCNEVDDDCDGAIDDDDSDLDTSTASTWYTDDDLDGYGDPSVTSTACDQPSGTVTDDTDCDDTDADVNPDASEVCNAIDDDCDGTADSDSACGCNVDYYTSSVEPYLFCEDALTWADAQSTCDSLGYHLLTIDDASENAWADSTADTWSTDKWWMGFNDRTTEGTWEWEDGSTVSYTNWESGEPNDSGGNEDCGQLNRFDPDQTWNDEPCSSSFYFICEAY